MLTRGIFYVMVPLTSAVLQVIISLFNALPRHVREAILWIILRVFIFITPKYKKIALRNLNLIFPDREKTFYSKTLLESFWRLARIASDSIFLPRVDKEWASKHIRFDRFEEWQAQFNKGAPGPVILSGHLGSFELIIRLSAIYGAPMAFVYRKIKFKPLDELWRKERERYGNPSIDRSGALRRILGALTKGTAVGLVADQNVRREHAIFRPFFGKLAATSKALGVAAVKMRSPVIFVSIANEKDGKYSVSWERYPAEEIYDDNSLDFDAKVEKITDLYLRSLEREIRKDPASWFLLHRRWKTTPEGVAEDFYD